MYGTVMHTTDVTENNQQNKMSVLMHDTYTVNTQEPRISLLISFPKQDTEY